GFIIGTGMTIRRGIGTDIIFWAGKRVNRGGVQGILARLIQRYTNAKNYSWAQVQNWMNNPKSDRVEFVPEYYPGTKIAREYIPIPKSKARTALESGEKYRKTNIINALKEVDPETYKRLEQLVIKEAKGQPSEKNMITKTLSGDESVKWETAFDNMFEEAPKTLWMRRIVKLKDNIVKGAGWIKKQHSYRWSRLKEGIDTLLKKIHIDFTAIKYNAALIQQVGFIGYRKLFGAGVLREIRRNRLVRPEEAVLTVINVLENTHLKGKAFEAGKISEGLSKELENLAFWDMHLDRSAIIRVLQEEKFQQFILKQENGEKILKEINALLIQDKSGDIAMIESRDDVKVFVMRKLKAVNEKELDALLDEIAPNKEMLGVSDVVYNYIMSSYMKEMADLQIKQLEASRTKMKTGEQEAETFERLMLEYKLDALYVLKLQLQQKIINMEHTEEDVIRSKYFGKVKAQVTEQQNKALTSFAGKEIESLMYKQMFNTPAFAVELKTMMDFVKINTIKYSKEKGFEYSDRVFEPNMDTYKVRLQEYVENRYYLIAKRSLPIFVGYYNQALGSGKGEIDEAIRRNSDAKIISVETDLVGPKGLFRLFGGKDSDLNKIAGKLGITEAVDSVLFSAKLLKHMRAHKMASFRESLEAQLGRKLSINELKDVAALGKELAEKDSELKETKKAQIKTDPESALKYLKKTILSNEVLESKNLVRKNIVRQVKWTVLDDIVKVLEAYKEISKPETESIFNKIKADPENANQILYEHRIFKKAFGEDFKYDSEASSAIPRKAIARIIGLQDALVKGEKAGEFFFDDIIIKFGSSAEKKGIAKFNTIADGDIREYYNTFLTADNVSSALETERLRTGFEQASKKLKKLQISEEERAKFNGDKKYIEQDGDFWTITNEGIKKLLNSDEIKTKFSEKDIQKIEIIISDFLEVKQKTKGWTSTRITPIERLFALLSSDSRVIEAATGLGKSETVMPLYLAISSIVFRKSQLLPIGFFMDAQKLNQGEGGMSQFFEALNSDSKLKSLLYEDPKTAPERFFEVHKVGGEDTHNKVLMNNLLEKLTKRFKDHVNDTNQSQYMALIVDPQGIESLKLSLKPARDAVLESIGKIIFNNRYSMLVDEAHLLGDLPNLIQGVGEDTFLSLSEKWVGDFSAKYHNAMLGQQIIDIANSKEFKDKGEIEIDDIKLKHEDNDSIYKVKITKISEDRIKVDVNVKEGVVKDNYTGSIEYSLSSLENDFIGALLINKDAVKRGIYTGHMEGVSEVFEYAVEESVKRTYIKDYSGVSEVGRQRDSWKFNEKFYGLGEGGEVRNSFFARTLKQVDSGIYSRVIKGERYNKRFKRFDKDYEKRMRKWESNKVTSFLAEKTLSRNVVEVNRAMNALATILGNKLGENYQFLKPGDTDSESNVVSGPQVKTSTDDITNKSLKRKDGDLLAVEERVLIPKLGRMTATEFYLKNGKKADYNVDIHNGIYCGHLDSLTKNPKSLDASIAEIIENLRVNGGSFYGMTGTPLKCLNLINFAGARVDVSMESLVKFYGDRPYHILENIKIIRGERLNPISPESGLMLVKELENFIEQKTLEMLEKNKIKKKPGMEYKDMAKRVEYQKLLRYEDTTETKALDWVREFSKTLKDKTKLGASELFDELLPEKENTPHIKGFFNKDSFIEVENLDKAMAEKIKKELIMHVSACEGDVTEVESRGVRFAKDKSIAVGDNRIVFHIISKGNLSEFQIDLWVNGKLKMENFKTIKFDTIKGKSSEDVLNNVLEVFEKSKVETMKFKEMTEYFKDKIGLSIEEAELKSAFGQSLYENAEVYNTDFVLTLRRVLKTGFDPSVKNYNTTLLVYVGPDSLASEVSQASGRLRAFRKHGETLTQDIKYVISSDV
ncbi:hypothetical protein KKC59_04190, partial [bacterium]|nr:hypothetical protein [bacterium]